MILQALTDYYEVLAEQDRISKPGWGLSKVSFGLEVDDNGEVIALHSLKTEQKVGKKTEMRPRIMEVPVQSGRSGSTPPSYFICDFPTYFLGSEYFTNAEKGSKYFETCAMLHTNILSDVKTPASNAIKNFFNKWHPSQAKNHPILSPYWDELTSGDNLIFFYRYRSALEDDEIRAAWQTHYQSNQISEKRMQCLVSGEESFIAKTHPKIKGFRGQTMGGTLVGFNESAYESFEQKQNFNSPVGHYAAFAYTTALNHLLADRNRCQTIGDTTVVCWAQTGEEAYQDVGMMGMMGQSPQEETEADVRRALSLLSQGKNVQWEDTELSPHTPFYILGLSPNAARISVRFFLRDSFGKFLSNVQQHQDRLEIVKPNFDKHETLPLWHLLQETVNQKSRDKSPAPQLSGDMLRSILEGGRYPSTLLSGVTLRIRAEQSITRGRAAILKAYYLKNPHPQCPKEVLTVALNEHSTNIPYTLGRLFSVLEAVQKEANSGINTTIKDKYFNSASATPSIIFPTLINLSQKHLRKIDGGYKIFFDKQMQELLGILAESYPQRLTLPEQGAFQLGYYHQTQKRYEKKEDK